MGKRFSFFIEMIVKKIFIIIFLLFVCQYISFAQVVYVDCNTGNDNNNGTIESPLYSIDKAAEIIQSKDNDIFIMKINPGIYVLDKHISVFTEKEMTGKRIIIEANILPDDTLWTPEKMPVILSSAPKGEFENKRWVVAFLVNENHVTIRGLKFQGYAYPNTQYFPIARMNGQKTDLLVEQCMFVGDQQSAAIQVGVIGNGNEIKLNHCIFYKANNAVVYFKDSGNGIKKGNSLTNSIIYGASEAALWTSWPDSDFFLKIT